MDTVNIALSLSAALLLLRNDHLDEAVRDAVQTAIEKAFNVASSTHKLNLTLKSVVPDQKIPCIAAIRHSLGWGLRECKEFVEVVLGKPDYSNGYYNDIGGWVTNVKYYGGQQNTLTIDAADAANLQTKLRELGCDVVVDTRGC